MKKLLCALMALVMLICFCPSVYAETGMSPGVSEEMCKSDYWKSRTIIDANEVLMTADDIKEFNNNAFAGSGTYIVGIENIKATYDADYQRQIMQFDVPARALYIDGKKIDSAEYYKKINDAILNTGYKDKSKETEYAVVVRQTDMKYIPTSDVIGYSATDCDDEMEYENLCVNEPFAVRQMCEIDGEKFYYGWSTDCVGWVPAEDLAICADKEEWLDAWYNEIDGKDFIVVTQDKLNLEPSLRDKDLSDLKLTLGTTLKLVEKENIPTTIDGRNSWNNYAVYIPTRDADGNYVKKAALIPQHYSISVGYLPFTQANLLDVAFSCIGNRYGWGGMLDSYDCSLYTRTVYRCFGLTYPRNCSWQQNVPNTKIDMSAMTDEQKQQLIETLPAGTSLFFSGHTMMYLGTENSVSYVISSLGTVVAPEGSNNVNTVYNICVTPLNVRRGASYGYSTWLHNLNSVVMVMPKYDISKCKITAKKDCKTDEISVCVMLGDKELYEGINYTIEADGDNVTIKGINNFSGTDSVIATKHTDENGDGFCDICNENISGNKFILFINFFKKILMWIANILK